MILHWTAFLAICVHVWPMGCRLDMPVGGLIPPQSASQHLTLYKEDSAQDQLNT